MKRLFTLFAFMGLMTVAFGQLPVDPATKKITFSEVVTSEGQTPAALYKQALAWGQAQGFTVDTKTENSTIVFKAFVPVKYNSVQRGGTETGKVNFTISIWCKDGRYKYKMTSFVHSARHASCGALESETSACTKYQILPGSWQAVKDQTKTETEKLIKELQKAMKKPEAAPAVDTDDNW